MDWSRIVDMWQVVGGIGTVISILVTVHFYKKSKMTARLALAFSQPSWLVNVDRNAAGGDIGSAADRIIISYDGNPVRNAFIVQGRVVNRGNTPLKEQDVHRPLTFSFVEGAQLLSAAIADTYPAGLEVDIGIINASSARLSLGLLNPGDTVLLTFVSTGQLKTPTPSARIEGVSRLEREIWQGWPSGGSSFGVILLVFTLMEFFVVAVVTTIIGLWPGIPSSLLVLVAVALMVFSFLKIGTPIVTAILKRVRIEYFES